MRPWPGIVAAAVALIASTGTVAAAAPPAAARASAPTSAPPAAARADALAGHLVAEMTFPPGTRPAPLRTIPSALRDAGPAGAGWFRAARLLVAPVKPAAVWAVLLPHKPFDDGGSMDVAGDNGPAGSDTLLPAPEPGVAAADAAVWLEPWHNGTTLIAAYGFATWLPVRTAAEHLNPASIRAVTITASTIVPHQGTVKRTFTSAEVIGRITAFLDKRPAAPELAIPCPLAATTYQASFAPDKKGGPVVTASFFCMTDQITVNGMAQPQLWDTSGGLATMLSDLIGD